jgi:hypothetical protein
MGISPSTEAPSLELDGRYTSLDPVRQRFERKDKDKSETDQANESSETESVFPPRQGKLAKLAV